ncbi:unnamed protein product, partial [Phaeothamnion confervicola]
ASLWGALLKDAMRRNRTPDSTVLLVGPADCGKSALIRRFQGSPFAAEGSGQLVNSTALADGTTGAGDSYHPLLSFAHFAAVDPFEPDNEREDMPARVSVWGCSETEFEPLLQTVLKPERLPHTAVLLALDLSKPWTLMRELEQWAAAVSSRIAALTKQLPAEARAALQEA